MEEFSYNEVPKQQQNRTVDEEFRHRWQCNQGTKTRVYKVSQDRKRVYREIDRIQFKK